MEITPISSPRLETAVAVFSGQFESCPHKKTKLVSRTFSNGSVHYCNQCQICGTSVSKVKKRDLPRGRLGVWNDSIRLAWRDVLNRLYEMRREVKDKQFWGWNREYLQSPAWKAISKKVLDRANGLCEGCGERTACEVHHVTYKHVGNEFLFELKAVCGPCHDRLHREPEKPWLNWRPRR
jgi:5-methylcytosine-specific restriction endonuclease McrA